MTKALLDIQSLTLHFGDTQSSPPVIDQLNFSLYKGQCLALVGESGSGKTLSALAMMQLLPSTAYVDTQSRILLNDEDVLQYSERRMRHIRGHRIGMIFQDAMSAFNPVLTIGQQLLEICTRKKALTLLEEVGIADVARSFYAYPHQLSGGMRQRAMIAMALAGEPDIIIADEPTTALDVTIQAQVLRLLKSLQTKHQAALLFISHDLAVVSHLADDILVMRHGKKIEESDVTSFFKQPTTDYSRQLLAAIPLKKARRSELINRKTCISVKHLNVYFPIRKGLLKRTVDHVKAVNNVSFDLYSGETLALVGESGSGKTTTGKAIIRLLQETQGQIQFLNQDLSKLNRKNMRLLRSQIQIIFQDPYAALNPRMIISDSVAEGLIAQKKVKTKQQALEKVDAMLQKVGLTPDMKWRYPHEFSGGQRQRICIARALILEPRLLILDEPTSALDVSIQMQILQLLESLQKEMNLTYLFISHNLSVVAHIAHRIAVMHRGKIIEQGPTQTILEHPQKAYTQQLIAAIPEIPIYESS